MQKQDKTVVRDSRVRHVSCPDGGRGRLCLVYYIKLGSHALLQASEVNTMALCSGEGKRGEYKRCDLGKFREYFILQARRVCE